ncbi:transformation/transcription domain-associated protein-like [Aphis gossypii]|uniref:transformation/transcription domain-associated protein-like n=1 Tax=Aphis gossypii TaxID=80765 RepID=UPI00215907FC|nr:transformation/transcription domain-associated protein-like [Aphis gossypii]
MAAVQTEMILDHESIMDKYRSDITLLTDPNVEDEQKLEIVQTLNENFEIIEKSHQYPTFLKHMIKHFIRILVDGEPYFIAEYHIFQVRKLVLEIIYKLPCNEFLKPHVDLLVTLCMKLMETDNEQNGILCIRIFVELQKNFRPPYKAEIRKFLQYTKKIYWDIPDNMEKIFSMRTQQRLRINDLSTVDISEILDNTYYAIVINCETSENNIETYNVIPRSISSLKILQELPISIVLIYQLYKDNVTKYLSENIPTMIRIIALQPSMLYKSHSNYNEEILVELIETQIKILSCLAYIIKLFTEIVTVHSTQLVEGMIGMLESSPMEVTHLRKEFLIASRHILNTDLRIKFIPYMDKLLDENTLLGRGWTNTENLKPLVYSTIADLIQHVQVHLSLPTIVKVINLFAINVHDHSLTPSMQLVSCKVLMNLVDCIRKKNGEDVPDLKCTQGETVSFDLLIRIIQVNVLKLKMVSKLYIPAIISKNTTNTLSTGSSQILDINEDVIIDDIIKREQKELTNSPCGKKLKEKTKYVFSSSPTALFSLSECRTLVKVLICCIKTAAWGIAKDKTNKDDSGSTLKLPVKPQLVKIYLGLVKWSLQAMDVYMINPLNNQNIYANVLRPRSKEEKEAMDHLRSVFVLLPPSIFKEIFSTTIPYFIERVEKNHALMYISESLLNNSLNTSDTSSIFTTLLLEHLLSKLEDMGNGNSEQSNLYLKLFKQVFDSVNQYSIESEQTLQPYLNQIVNSSMKLALTAKDPYYYFLLLRPLFRCIGGGAHGVLYQEFLPLLPNLLKSLNSLQSGLHKQDMKDLFVELCLTVPVRLSSLLPHLPLLMDPLVSALNGSPSLIIQGLRTLELCVDNLQTDFLYEHIQPVRADLMQALWRSLHNTNENVYPVAFRVLGKFGGGNRKMMTEPQRLDYSMHRQSTKPAIIIKFNEHTESVTFNVDMAIETAAESLKTSTDPYYRKKCWEVIKSFLAASVLSNDDKSVLMKFFSHPSFKEGKISNFHSTVYKYPDPVVRNTYVMALNGIFVSAAVKELRDTALGTLLDVVMRYTMVAISQQAGPLVNSEKNEKLSFGMDPLVLIDSMATVMSYQEKELLKPTRLALTIILNTATIIMGSKERACQLPYMEYMVDKLCALCYDRAWYTKFGGCYAIQFFYSSMSSQWVFEHLYLFVKAQLFVIMDLSGDVSNGVLDETKKNLENMLRKAASPLDQNSGSQLQALQKKAIHEVTYELIRQVTSPNDLLRNHSTHLLSVIASAQGITVTQVMEPHKERLSEIIPLRKHLLRHQGFKAQIGMMEGNTFCTSLLPRLFTIDLNIKEHNLFYHEVSNLCEASDSVMSKLPGYKTMNPEQMLLLRQAGIRALAACYYIPQPEVKSRIFNALYGALDKNNPDLQETVFQCLRKFVSTSQIDMPMVHELMKKHLGDLGDYRSLTLNGTRHLWYLVQLFPASFSDMFCTHLMEIMKNMFEVLIQMKKGISKSGNYESIMVIIIEMYKHLSLANYWHIESLCRLVLDSEKSLQVNILSPFHTPLLGCLLKYPTQIVQLFLQDNHIKEPNWVKYLHMMIANEKCQTIREALQSSSHRLNELITTSHSDPTKVIQYETIRIINSIVRLDRKWIYNQTDLIISLSELWASEHYQEHFLNPGYLEFSHWNEPKMLAKVLLQYFIHNPNEIDLLFHLIRAFCYSFISDFQFLRTYLEETVAKTFSPQWKRKAFFRFVEIFQNNNMSNLFKSKILQYIILPSVSASYENNEQQALIYGTSDHSDSTGNIVKSYIYQLINHEVPPGIGDDSIRIHLLQLGCMLVDDFPVNKESAYSPDELCENLKRVMSYAWRPCSLEKNCVDPTAQYSGHLLLSYIIASYHVDSQIIIQVFHELLKAHHVEVKIVVRQALDLITPALSIRMNNGNKLLCQCTKKIIVEEAHLMQQLFHVLHLVVRHYNVYYPIRHRLIQHMLNTMYKLAFISSATFEQKKLAVEIAEVIIKWELQRIRNENNTAENSMEENVIKMKLKSPVSLQLDDYDKDVSISKNDLVVVLNYLAKLACQVNDGVSGSMAELLSKRCIVLLRTALKSEGIMSRCIDMLKLAWMENVFCTVSSLEPATNNAATAIVVANIASAFDLLTFFLTILPKEQLLNTIKPLQKSLYDCITTTNIKIGRMAHAFLTRLIYIFPMIKPYLNELEELYILINVLIDESLNNFEKNISQNYNRFLTCVIMLKAASANNAAFIDNLSSRFVHVLQKVCREQPQNTNTESSMGISELVIQSLDLMKNRVTNMHIETRKTFIGTVLVGLIEKTNDSRIMKTILKMLEEWMHNHPNEGPNLHEKSILLVKIMQHIEKKFPDLNTQYLYIIIHIYKDEELRNSELGHKLEAAFLSGLRCSQPAVREKFFTLFNQHINIRLPERLLYIVSSQNWEPMMTHYWIKQCIELLLATVDPDLPVTLKDSNSSTSSKLPTIRELVNNCDTSFIEEILNTNEDIGVKSEYAMDTDQMVTDNIEVVEGGKLEPLISRHIKFMDNLKSMKLGDICSAIAQLCHMDSSLAEKIWLVLFPAIWESLNSTQKTILLPEINQFIVSGIHVVQRDVHPSVNSTFFEALFQCQPKIHFKPSVMLYIGKSHNLWHRVTLSLEKMMIDNNFELTKQDCYEFEPEISPQTDVTDTLAEMYKQLKEEDMWAGLWQKHAQYRETKVALALEQQGLFEQALSMYESVIKKFQSEFSSFPASDMVLNESQLWESQWIRCSKELNQWDSLLEFSKLEGHFNSFLILDSAWRIPDWRVMSEALSYVDNTCPKEFLWKMYLYKGFLAICHPDEPNLPYVARNVEMASIHVIREWRRLPHIVSHIHLHYLQASQQIIELSEAAQIHQGLQEKDTNNSLHNMKAIIKTWKNRLPVVADDLSHWSDVFVWRQHHYQFVIKCCSQPNQSTNAVLGVHASAQAIIHFGKVSRKHNLTGVCLQTLSRLYTIPNVPVVDCFHKIRQQVKCYMQMASESSSKHEIQDCLEAIERTNLKFFQSEMTAEFYALKGMLLGQIGNSEEAYKAFSAAVQLHDSMVKAWALWGEYLEETFTKSYPNHTIQTGVSAIICFLQACRQQNESKYRKYLAKVLWLLTYDDKEYSLLSTVDTHFNGVPPALWLPWVPQLLTTLASDGGSLLQNLLIQVGRLYPQAVYFPTRTLYFNHKIEYRERCRNSELLAATYKQSQTNHTSQKSTYTQSTGLTDSALRATPAMVRFSKIMHQQREVHPTIVLTLEGIVDQMVWFRENWYEEVLRQLRLGLAKCYNIAFDSRGSVVDAQITPHTLNFIKKLVSTFGIGIELLASNMAANSAAKESFPGSGSESLAKRAQTTIQDPVFQKMKQQFSIDFDFNLRGAMKLHHMISKMKKWIKILETKIRLLPKFFLIEEKCRFLSNFSLQTAEIEIPGEFLLPKHSHYYVKIARFMPTVQIVEKHNTSARRLVMRGHNGKLYSYLVMHDAGLGDTRREERVLQLLRMLNHYLTKQKETSRRFLYYTVPRVVAVSPQLRLVEDNPSSLSLLDIFKSMSTTQPYDDCIEHYYQCLANIQNQGTQANIQMLLDIFLEVQKNYCQSHVLKSWATLTYASPTDYWTFRKMLTLQLSLSCLAEYVLHLTRLNPDMMYIHQDSGLLNASYFKFDVDDKKGELVSNRPVPFRLTPNLVELMTDIGKNGPLTASIMATARCFNQPNNNIQAILRAILRDEMITSYKKKLEDELSTARDEISGDIIINMVTKAVNSIIHKLNSLANFDGTDNKVSTIVSAASSVDNLCRIDPAWYPWL